MATSPAPKSPELVAAEVAKLKAEATEALANASRFDAEAEHYRILTQRVAAEAARAQIHAESAQLEADYEKSADQHNRRYRFTGEVNGTSVNACINRTTEWSRMHPGEPIEIIFSSPGGSVVDGFALYDHLLNLRATGHKLTIGTVGMAASMAGVLVQAGDHRWMGSQAWYLIHRAAYGAVGSSFEVEDKVAWIKRIEKRIIDIFVTRSGGTLDMKTIKRNWERRDWWLDADECLKYGLIDEIRGAIA